MNVCFWHKADIRCGAMQCPLLGVKRTSDGRTAMSAFDPKQTWAFQRYQWFRYDTRLSKSGATMRRREFFWLLGGAAAAWPLTARAQRSATAVVGVLSPEGPTTGNVNGLIQGLRELGYVEGRNIRFEYRFAEGKFDRLSELAADLVRLNVDVIVAFVTQATEAAKKQTSTIPIVMVGVSDPIGAGLAASLAHPGAMSPAHHP